MRFFLLTAAVLCAVMAAGLVWAWPFGPFDDPAWRADAPAWGWTSIAAFAASCHHFAYLADKYLDGRASQP